MSALACDPPQPATALRAMREADLVEVHALEIRAYEFPWTLGIFHDCLRANYPAWVLQVDGRIGGYFLMSIAAGEAHVLNVCVAKDRGDCFRDNAGATPSPRTTAASPPAMDRRVHRPRSTETSAHRNFASRRG